MIQKFFTVVILIASATTSMAGTIANGTWAPSACGAEPEVPVIEQGGVDAYNNSVKVINEWQEKANTYNTCLINEANADNAVIAKSAHDQQSRLQTAVEKIKTDIEAARAALNVK